MSNNKFRVGLITAPGYAKRISEGLSHALPDLLSYYVDDRVEWEVEYETDALTGATENSSEILGATFDKKEEHEWDYVISLTDLPLFKRKKAIVAEAYVEQNTALLSIPALGVTPLIKRIRESTVQLINEMYYGTSDEDREQAEKRIQQKDQEDYGEHQELKNKDAKRLVGKRFLDRLSPIQRETPDEEESNIDVRFTVRSKWVGALRILAGMIRANRPWAMFPSFMKLIVVAFATGAYALVFPTLWMLSSNYGIWRMVMVSVVAIAAMVLWITLAHQLWESKRKATKNYLRKLYNLATISTLFLTVLMYYGLLFILFSIAVVVLIPMGMLESQVSTEVGYVNYVYIAWTATSIATIIGALGSALENEEVVLSAAYGYRQRQRYNQLKSAQEEKKEAQEEKKEAQEEKKEAAQEKKESRSGDGESSQDGTKEAAEAKKEAAEAKKESQEEEQKAAEEKKQAAEEKKEK
ncbi:MFS transporter [Salimicrobium album]|uniref:5,10-methylene-tetrahydrofolate dehydrogenase n=1 Tax=Salimicrobium album TaxID=50717 RepID=A0A1H3BJR9_9BACI|nr:hypothetical protein [Salimicrobium album]SDX42137.1 hypothetical protein SAMN04488081_0466 [Salimicrobium album]